MWLRMKRHQVQNIRLAMIALDLKSRTRFWTKHPSDPHWHCQKYNYHDNAKIIQKRLDLYLWSFVRILPNIINFNLMSLSDFIQRKTFIQTKSEVYPQKNGLFTPVLVQVEVQKHTPYSLYIVLSFKQNFNNENKSYVFALNAIVPHIILIQQIYFSLRIHLMPICTSPTTSPRQ